MQAVFTASKQTNTASLTLVMDPVEYSYKGMYICKAEVNLTTHMFASQSEYNLSIASES